MTTDTLLKNGTGASREPDASSEGGSAAVASSEPIAIVGMACRFSGDANSPSKLWENCVQGKDAWSPIPADRYDMKAWYHSDHQRQGRSHVKGGYFLNQDVSHFDAAFFNISNDFANDLDPQTRLLLESTYEAMEDAGIPADKVAGSNTSVFTAAFSKDYHELQVKDPEGLRGNFIGAVGTATLSNRISHFFDMQGPSMTVDTGCSGSLVALHQACQSLRCGESETAIVGAANVMLHQDAFIYLGSLGALGATGRCYAWDSRAEGYGRGEGVACLVLKPLSVALRSGDRVHAVIRESALNQDGKTHTMWSPSMDAQVRLIEDCYRRAGLDMAETGYVEAHMTGTVAGDPIEAEALARTFGASRRGGTDPCEDEPVLVGSIKTNVGHTEAASGLAAVIKTVFALKNRVIPPNLNYQTPSPHIPLDQWGLQVPTELTPWPANKPFRASVNNFGYGGTNAHLILERAAETTTFSLNESPSKQINGHRNGNGDGTYLNPPTRSRVYVFSAKSSVVLGQIATEFTSHIRQALESHIPQRVTADNLAYTLEKRRSLFEFRKVIRSRSLEDLCDRLELSSSGTQAAHATRKPRLGFVFNGQGAQWHAMARELIAEYPVFSHALRDADTILRGFGATWSLLDELMRDANSTRVGDVAISQPATVSVQLCLVDLLESWGITPSAVTSHSSGEIAASYAAGALSFQEALGVAYFRGELAWKHRDQGPGHGGMLAVGLSQEDVAPYLQDLKNGQVVVVACVNSPRSVTLSGDLSGLNEVAARLAEKDIFSRLLKVPLAYHSHHMLPMAEEYAKQLQSILGAPASRSWKPQGIVYSSPTTGEVVQSAKVLGPSHWVRNLTSPVRFVEAVEGMVWGPDGPRVDFLIEVGAHGTLSTPLRDILKARGIEIPYASCLMRLADAVETMQDVACELMRHGYPVALEAVNFPAGAARDELPVFVPDLPSYPWNHTSRYWRESRVAYEQRQPRFPAHELLGSPLAGANGSTPTWRSLLRLSDVEWLADHRVGDEVVLPGAAYIAMAVEALRLLTQAEVESSDKKLQVCRLRDVDFLHAMVVPETPEGIEVQLCLRPCSDKDLEREGWFEFDISSFQGTSTSWTQNAKGFIFAEIGSQTKAETTFKTSPPTSPGAFLGDSTSNKMEGEEAHIDVETIFRGLREMGLYHGPHFQNLIASRAAQGRGRAVTDISVGDLATNGQEYVLHPTTLDSIFQATYGCPAPGDSRGRGSVLFLPRSIRAMSIPLDVHNQAGHQLRVFTEFSKADGRGTTYKIMVVNCDDQSDEQATTTNASYIRIDDFFLHAMPRETEEENIEVPSLCSRFSWEPDVLHDLSTRFQPVAICPSDEQSRVENNCVRAAYYLIDNAVRELHIHELLSGSSEPHLRRFYDWMTFVVQEKPGKTSAWSKASSGMRRMVFDELSAEDDGSCQLLVHVGEQLSAIVRGEGPGSLELMMQRGLLNRYYRDFGPLTRSYQHMAHVVKLFAAKHPGARIVEIGAGTGGATSVVLDAFGAKARQTEFPGSLLGHYTFTDISAGFFETARQNFAAWEGLVDYKQLNIEEDPTAQSFASGSYDLVVASLVLHATRNLRQTLANARKLLRPGGKLLLIETTRDRLDMQLIFGTLAGWWLGEEESRRTTPNVDTDAWNEALREAGFSGLDLEIPDCEDPEIGMLSVMLSTAVETGESIRGPISLVYGPGGTPPPQAWLSQLCSQIQNDTGIIPSVASLDQIVQDPSRSEQLCVFLGEMEHPLVSQLDETAFEKLRTFLVETRDVLWLSSGGLITSEEPLFAATSGLLRTLRQEDPSKRYIHLDFERQSSLTSSLPDEHGAVWATAKIKYIAHVLQQSFNQHVTNTDSVEREYALKDSVLHVARAYPDNENDLVCANKEMKPVPEMQFFHQADRRRLVWQLSGSGLLSDLRFVPSPFASDDIPSGEVEVEAQAFGLNFRDIMCALGLLDTTRLGHELAGVVTRLGPDTEQSGLQIGDRVCGMAWGFFASTSRVSWKAIAKIPDDMSLSDAASIPSVFVTAYHSLSTIARLQEGESVLVHAATGGVGQAAIVLAQRIGAEVFATCSTQTKRDLLIQQYHLAPDHILSSRDASFADAIMARTQGRGVDVVLNSLSGPLLKASWDCIARFGRFVEIGKVDMEAGRHLDMTPFTRCATYASVDVLQLIEHGGLAMREALQECVRICRERRTGPVFPVTTYSIAEMEKAMRHMQSGTHTGKLVLVPGKQDMVKVVPLLLKQPLSLDDDNAVYLVVGGLGGIGRSVAEWMMENGAKNLILTSRHATSHPDADTLKAKGISMTCNVQIRDCDIADQASLVRCLSDCQKTMPPIRGLVNAAMVLEDAILEQMTFDKWQKAVRPKIQGSWNLHNHLPHLDFYIMLSSVAGVVGSPSQANYGAGGAFQDALARYRTSKGLPATALDLGVVLSAGYVAERERAGDDSVRRRIERQGFVSIKANQVLALVEAAIRSPLAEGPDGSQLLVSVTDRTTATWARDGRPLDPRFGTLQVARRGHSAAGQSTASGSGHSISSAEAVAAVAQALSDPNTTPAQAAAVLAEALTLKIAAMFDIPSADIDTSLPMARYGVDSLVAVELRKWLSGNVARAKVSVFDILQSASLKEFSKLVAEKSNYMISKKAIE